MNKIFLFLIIAFSSLSASINCSNNSCAVSKDMTFWGIDLYHLSYTINKNGNEKLTLTYKRDISKEKNIDKTIEKFDQNNNDADKYADLLNDWNSNLIDVCEGTVYEVVVDCNGATMYIDKNKLFHTSDKKFGKMYLNIWSGEKSVDEDLREEILLAKSRISLKP